MRKQEKPFLIKFLNEGRLIKFLNDKGTVSVQIASKFGFDVGGIDAMSEFLKDAKKKSSENQVSDLCAFMEQDKPDSILSHKQDHLSMIDDETDCFIY
ncbi:MAG: hypothetical protein ACOC5T_03405 [Elusimicrobiota bacterium]